MNLYGCQKIKFIKVQEYLVTFLIRFKIFATTFGDRTVGATVLAVES